MAFYFDLNDIISEISALEQGFAANRFKVTRFLPDWWKCIGLLIRHCVHACC
jgi:hypothetical protein